MGATNYFKVAGEVFFFDERDRSTVETAFQLAQQVQRANVDAATSASVRPSLIHEPITVWQRVRASGPWDACREVGESRREAEVWS